MCPKNVHTVLPCSVKSCLFWNVCVSIYLNHQKYFSFESVSLQCAVGCSLRSSIFPVSFAVCYPLRSPQLLLQCLPSQVPHGFFCMCWHLRFLTASSAMWWPLRSSVVPQFLLQCSALWGHQQFHTTSAVCLPSEVLSGSSQLLLQCAALWGLQ